MQTMTIGQAASMLNVDDSAVLLLCNAGLLKTSPDGYVLLPNITPRKLSFITIVAHLYVTGQLDEELAAWQD